MGKEKHREYLAEHPLSLVIINRGPPALVAFAKYQNIEELTREILIELVEALKWLEEYKAFGYAQGLGPTEKLINEIKVKQAQMANTPTTVTNEPFTMKTSKFLSAVLILESGKTASPTARAQ